MTANTAATLGLGGLLLRALFVAALGAGAMTACVPGGDGDPVGDRDAQPDPDAEPEPDAGFTSDTCSAEPSDPAAQATVEIGDPTTAESATVVVTNRDEVARMVRVGLRSHAGGKLQSVDKLPVPVDPGATVSLAFSLRDVGALATSLRLPVMVTPKIVVEDETGAVIETIYADPFRVGPPIDAAIADVLADFGLTPSLLPIDQIDGGDAVLAGAELSNVGLEALELAGPGEDEGPALPEPNYADGVPDAEGLFHLNLCFRWPVAWVDAGFGEDYGVQPEGTWRARGSRMYIEANDEVLFDDYLDFDGCTGVIHTPHNDGLIAVAASKARINGNDVVVRDETGNLESFVRVLGYVGGSGTKHYTLPETDRSNLLAATTFTLARFGSISAELFEVNDRCKPFGNNCCDCAGEDGIWINRRTRKFIISHEVGHRILQLHTGGYNASCSGLTVSTNHPCYSSSSHAIDSLELASCAAMEGWAHFVATYAYNDATGNNPGATFQYWRDSGLTVDVEEGPTGGVTKYYETMCGGNGANANGAGVELDWLRHWWDYRTNPSPGYAPHQSVIMDEIEANSGWSDQMVYSFIRDGIESESGAEQADRWEQIAAGNGVDH